MMPLINKTPYNSGFKKLAVQWLNQVQFSNQTFVKLDSFVLRNRQLLNPANRWVQTITSVQKLRENKNDNQHHYQQVTA
jgi:hypothetical protein